MGGLMDLHDGDPFWLRRDGLLAVYPPLLEDVRCDVVVVGGGITGSLIALELSGRGLDVVVLDRREIACGSTAASTSMLQYEIDELLVDLTDALGREAAEVAYTECARGIDLVDEATRKVGDACGFRRSPSVYAAVRPRDVELLRRELDARAEAGFDVAWLEGQELRDRWGVVGHAAIESAAGGSVDPFRLAHACLGVVLDRGGRVHDRTAVTGYERTRRGITVQTDRGSAVRARWCVVATGYEVATLLPELPIDLNSSFALVSEPVDGLAERYPDGLLFWEHADPYLYGRTTDDGRFLVGGRDARYRAPVRRRRALPTKARALERDIRRRTPDLSLEVAFEWAGTFAETPDGLAYLGGHPEHPRMQFALGFGGNGITYSALAAQYLADAIEGRPDPRAEVFRLDRPVRRPG
jgi:glycine/D-amino acid oxidase-like deaminating enzyme